LQPLFNLRFPWSSDWEWDHKLCLSSYQLCLIMRYWTLTVWIALHQKTNFHKLAEAFIWLGRFVTLLNWILPLFPFINRNHRILLFVAYAISLVSLITTVLLFVAALLDWAGWKANWNSIANQHYMGYFQRSGNDGHWVSLKNVNL
jgi:hypothetical protein